MLILEVPAGLCPTGEHFKALYTKAASFCFEGVSPSETYS